MVKTHWKTEDIDAKEMYLFQEPTSLVPKTKKNVMSSSFSIARTIPFQNVPVRLPFFKLTVFKICWQKTKNAPFQYEREAYPSHFSPFSKYTGRSRREMCTGQLF